MRISKPFEKQGGFTQIDNDVLDHIMPTLKPSEWMVLSFIIRKTVGWHKESDGISYSQFIKGTGISSNSTIKKCLDSLVEKGLVLVGTTGHMADSHHYMLNKDYSFRVTETVERPVTFSVERPVTENVDTKESLKKEKQSAAIVAYENTFGPITYKASQCLNDDIDTYGITAVIVALSKAKERRAKAYAYVETILRGDVEEAKKKKADSDIWDRVQSYLNRTVAFKDLDIYAQGAIRHVGESRLKGAREGYELDQIKRQVCNYVQ